MSVLMIVAIIMAISGVIGYKRGLWPALLNLATLLAGFIFVEKDPQRLVDSMNALFIGLGLVARTGFGESSGLQTVARKMQEAEAPFTGEHTGLALVIVMIVAAVVGWLLGQRIKTKPSAVGAAVGIANGYVLAAAFVPWLTLVSADQLPVPFVREGQGLPVVTARQVGEAAGRFSLPPFLEWLSSEGGLPLVILVGVLAVFAVWRMKPRRSANGKDAH